MKPQKMGIGDAGCVFGAEAPFVTRRHSLSLSRSPELPAHSFPAVRPPAELKKDSSEGEEEKVD